MVNWDGAETRLRNEFAMAALPKIIAINDKVTAHRDVPYAVALKAVATQAYDIADAMLEARKKDT
ncbi:hypothetical protein DEM27_08295 [Metarhizobium album]|uniref:Uncharacterized protein n=1 Tax=Metarhizobium album TaxID=2182425 RepID=A0A2U2DT51_9HYPH|nr:hypothetical protein [Rhizobium album]PWE56389.1 hypothetical protein DEM27_08295 [Rhizobium album]